jgi:hypothetical protein
MNGFPFFEVRLFLSVSLRSMQRLRVLVLVVSLILIEVIQSRLELSTPIF